jgi:ribulose 1,5-bisphosphate synthetase/thiazole synthase
MAKIFADVSENEITRTISMMFSETIDEYANCDVIRCWTGRFDGEQRPRKDGC